MPEKLQVKRLEKIKADIVKAERETHFDMRFYFGHTLADGRVYLREGEVSRDFLEDCGTTCCIAGATVLRYSLDGKANIDTDGFAVFNQARKILGLTDNQARWLFEGLFTARSLGNITAKEAGEAIDHIIAGREVYDYSQDEDGQPYGWIVIHNYNGELIQDA